MTPRELYEIIEDLCNEHTVEEVKTTVMSIFEMIEGDKTKYDENVFEQYYPYVGAVVTSKEELMKHFACFLDFPEHCGSFIVRWKENEHFENRFSLEEIVEQINTKVEGE